MKFTPTTQKVCELCGELFWPESRNQRCCKNDHFRPCPVCGKGVPVKYKSDSLRCCSRKCSAELRKRNNLEKWGAENPGSVPEFQARMRQTCIDRYGVPYVFQSQSFKEHSKLTSITRYGVEYPMQSAEVKAKHQATCLQRHGVSAPVQLKHVREALLSVYHDPERLKHAASLRMRSGRHIASDGTVLDSGYELAIYEFCLRNGLQVERQVPIEFEYEGTVRTTLIDFRIEGQLVECKGSHLLQGCYDYANYMVPIEYKLEAYRDHAVLVVTSPDIRGLFDSVGYKDSNNHALIGVDIALFDSPEFPYPADRPPCFYSVRVSGAASAYEAFNDEMIRWRMICNRAQYTGGFIDGVQILRALNVTRVGKQPSWFSEAFARRLIEQYCSSELIVDPFAGWGTRASAAAKLHKKYQGCDLNAELVEWHHSRGYTNIVVGDAREYRCESSCSVLMCPPYVDADGHCIEDYNFLEFDVDTQKITQCQWLDIVMRNIPHASEYVMVCKVVDPGWEQYVVDTKVNKSHFGTNTEYVLVVPNSCPDTR